VQRITEQPNPNSLRLLELHANSDPKLVEAVVSDGKEKGIVKFRFEAQGPTAQTFSPEVLAHNRTPPVYISARPGSQAAPPTTSVSVQGAPNAGSQTQGQPSLPQASSGSSNSGSSSSSRMRTSSSGRPVRAPGSEGVHLPAP
jgi:hypothetical protein